MLCAKPGAGCPGACCWEGTKALLLKNALPRAGSTEAWDETTALLARGRSWLPFQFIIQIASGIQMGLPTLWLWFYPVLDGEEVFIQDQRIANSTERSILFEKNSRVLWERKDTMLLKQNFPALGPTGQTAWHYLALMASKTPHEPPV